MERTRTIQKSRQTVPDTYTLVTLLRAITDEDLFCSIETGELIEVYDARTHYRHNREKTIPTRVKYHRHYRTE